MPSQYIDYRGIIEDLTKNGQHSMPPNEVTRMGQVVGYDPNWNPTTKQHDYPKVSILLAGDTNPMHNFRFNDNYVPHIGDYVWVTVVGGAMWVTGALAGNNKEVMGNVGSAHAIVGHAEWKLIDPSIKAYANGFPWPFVPNSAKTSVPVSPWNPFWGQNGVRGSVFPNHWGSLTTPLLPNRLYQIDIEMSFYLQGTGSTTDVSIGIGVNSPWTPDLANLQDPTGKLWRSLVASPWTSADTTSGAVQNPSFLPANIVPSVGSQQQAPGVFHRITGSVKWSCVPSQQINPPSGGAVHDPTMWNHNWPQTFAWTPVLTCHYTYHPQNIFISDMSMTVIDLGVAERGMVQPSTTGTPPGATPPASSGLGALTSVGSTTSVASDGTIVVSGQTGGGTPAVWAKNFLTKINELLPRGQGNIPITENNITNICYWLANEQDNASFQSNQYTNLLGVGGGGLSTAPNEGGYQAVINATASNLVFGDPGYGYGAIIDALRNNVPPVAFATAVCQSHWNGSGTPADFAAGWYSYGGPANFLDRSPL